MDVNYFVDQNIYMTVVVVVEGAAFNKKRRTCSFED